MDNLDLQIKDIINLDMEITFLIGAGCSMDPPSCLPNAKEMMKNIINFACDKAYMDKILKLTNEIRFEYIVGIFQNYLDNDLKIIEYYNQSKSPNMQHFFIADMIRKGKQVITTNYDSLIEYALLKLGFEKDNIFPIITKKDYDDTSYTITLKIRESYNQAKLKNENRYVLTLTKKEIDCIYDIMVDLLIDFECRGIVEEIEDILPEFREEYTNDFKETLAITNAIFKKMGKPLQTFETLEKYLKQLNSLEDKE